MGARGVVVLSPTASTSARNGANARFSSALVEPPITRISFEGSATAAWAMCAFNKAGPVSHAPVVGVQMAVEVSAFAWTREGPSALNPPIMTIRPSASGVPVCQARLGDWGTARSTSQRCVAGFQAEPLPLPNRRIRPSGR